MFLRPGDKEEEDFARHILSVKSIFSNHDFGFVQRGDFALLSTIDKERRGGEISTVYIGSNILGFDGHGSLYGYVVYKSG